MSSVVFPREVAYWTDKTGRRFQLLAFQDQELKTAIAAGARRADFFAPRFGRRSVSKWAKTFRFDMPELVEMAKKAGSL